MFEGPCTVLGGLPMWAVCWYTRGDGWETEDDCGVTSLHWLKRDGSKGKEVSKEVYEKLGRWDAYWEGAVVEQVSDYLAHQQYLEEETQKCTLD